MYTYEYVYRVSPRVQSYIISLCDYVIQTVSLSICVQIQICEHRKKLRINASECSERLINPHDIWTERDEDRSQYTHTCTHIYTHTLTYSYTKLNFIYSKMNLTLGATGPAEERTTRAKLSKDNRETPLDDQESERAKSETSQSRPCVYIYINIYIYIYI